MRRVLSLRVMRSRSGLFSIQGDTKKEFKRVRLLLVATCRVLERIKSRFNLALKYDLFPGKDHSDQEHRPIMFFLSSRVLFLRLMRYSVLFHTVDLL